MGKPYKDLHPTEDADDADAFIAHEERFYHYLGLTDEEVARVVNPVRGFLRSLHALGRPAGNGEPGVDTDHGDHGPLRWRG